MIIQTAKSSDQKNKNAIEYGSMEETSVPHPVSLSYFFIIVRIYGIHAITGAMILVVLSPIR